MYFPFPYYTLHIIITVRVQCNITRIVRYLLFCMETSVQVFVLDFPPRLNHGAEVQELLRQEYNHITVRLGVRYLSISEHFSTGSQELWCKDGVSKQASFQ